MAKDKGKHTRSVVGDVIQVHFERIEEQLTRPAATHRILELTQAIATLNERIVGMQTELTELQTLLPQLPPDEALL